MKTKKVKVAPEVKAEPKIEPKVEVKKGLVSIKDPNGKKIQILSDDLARFVAMGYRADL